MTLKWEIVDKGDWLGGQPSVRRAKVPGGWFVRVGIADSASAFFYPDPEHLA